MTSQGMIPVSWISQALGNRLTEGDIDQVVHGRLKDRNPLPFQEKVANSGTPVTLVVAGCGNGKTIAAYLWAKRFAVGRKLFFCYPTTGTASAGFSDYLLAQTDIERTLVHSRSQIDMQHFGGMLKTQEDDIFEQNQRLESLLAWQKQVVACTVDTVLGVIQNQRRSLFSFPALLAAAIVFDEIHCYDAKLFTALLRFLEVFPQLPILLMTASLSPERERRLREVLGDRLGSSIKGDEKLENCPRYHLKHKSHVEDCWTGVREALTRNEKVLWVCNTVKDSIACWEYAKADNAISVQPILYHSRFRYRDRIDIQKKVLGAFDERNSDPCLVIATQVCEMSLDISADLLITALAPFPSLIQRMGRVNRRGILENGGYCIVYPFTCAERWPYRTSDLKTADNIVTRLVDRLLSQNDLAKELSTLPESSEENYEYSAWLGDLDDKDWWQSKQRPLREGGSINLLLAKDKPQILSRLGANRPTAQALAEWTIPMWWKSDVPMNTERLGGYPVVSEDFIDYDPIKGAQWRK